MCNKDKYDPFFKKMCLCKIWHLVDEVWAKIDWLIDWCLTLLRYNNEYKPVSTVVELASLGEVVEVEAAAGGQRLTVHEMYKMEMC